MTKRKALHILDKFAKHAIFNLHWIKDNTDRVDVEKVIRAYWIDARKEIVNPSDS